MQVGNLQGQLKPVLDGLARFRMLLFLVLVVGLYAFLGWRINTLENAQPSATAVAVSAPATPHINQDTINKIKSLQNNSVSVKTLFDQARRNPFQE